MISNFKFPILIAVAVFWQLQAAGQDTPDILVTGKTKHEQVVISYGADTLKPAPVTSTSVGKHWWSIFGYERLNELVLLALEQNHQLAAGQSQVKESEARLDLSRSALYPTVRINPSLNREELSANRPLPFDVPAEKVRYNTYTLPVELMYEVDIFGKNSSETTAGRLRLKSSEALQEASELDVAAAVARNFILLLMLDSEAEVFSRTREVRKENLDIVTTRYDAGLTNEMDMQRARTELSSVDVQLKNIQIERREAELQLAALSGQPADNFEVKSDGIRFLVPQMKPVSPQMLALNRPDLQAGKFAVEAYKHQLKNARRNRYPSLFVFGSAGLVSAKTDNLFENDSRNWLVGANLSIPVFEGRRRQALLDISEYQLENYAEQLKQNEVVASREVAGALAELRRLDEQLLHQQEFLEAAFRTADLSRQRYQKGLVTYLEVVDADRIVLEAERLLVQLLGRQLLGTVNLATALGGEAEQVYRITN
ncbi:efflux transporter outer membrane subunit [Gaoshiqia sp. Z1-71]|uniref:efflux transporter outer membrane subunit n=1 Tax=Gaoshiqia hydrogeniformans TaxID=3290090 RepID=UPI003BF7DA4A